MPLIDCLDCGKQISDAAEACIHCGRPLKLQSVASPQVCTTCQSQGNEIQLIRVKNEDVSSAVGCSATVLVISGIVLLFFVWPLGVVFIVGGVLVYSLAKKEVKIRFRCPKCHKWAGPAVTA